MVKTVLWSIPDAKGRKLGEQTELDTLVVLAVNDGHSVSAPLGVGALGNPISDTPGDYGRKTKTQRN